MPAALRLQIQMLSPLFMAGANPGQPAARAASFRGIFRYWTRAVLGACYQDDYAALKAHESRYWGSNQRGSSLRLVIDENPRREDADRFAVLPPRYPNGGQNVNPAYPVDATFMLRIDTPYTYRADTLFTDELYASLLLAFWLSGFGKRARRGGGSLRVVDADADVAAPALGHLTYAPTDADDAAHHLSTNIFQHVRNTAAGCSHTPEAPFGAIPDYPVMLPGHVHTFIAKNCFTGENAYLDALKQLWSETADFHHKYRRDPAGNIVTVLNKKGIPRKVEDKSAWGYSIDDNRRASVVHMRVIRSQAGLHPMITFMRAGKPTEDWLRLDQVMDVFVKQPADYIRITY